VELSARKKAQKEKRDKLGLTIEIKSGMTYSLIISIISLNFWTDLGKVCTHLDILQSYVSNEWRKTTYQRFCIMVHWKWSINCM